MTNFYATNTTVDIPGLTGLYEAECRSDGDAGADTGVQVSVPGGTSNASGYVFWTPSAAHSSADWPTTGYSASIEVTQIGSDISMPTASLRRTRASDGNWTAVLQVISGMSGTGVFTGSTNWFSVNNSVDRLQSDRFGLSTSISNSNMMTAGTITVKVNATTTYAAGNLSVGPAGSASGSSSWSGSATGESAPQGSASGSSAWSGTATGERTPEGSASGTDTWTGTATGQMPPVVQDGSASGSHDWTATATGITAREGDATGAHLWTGAADGAAQHGGSTSGSHDWTASTTGARSPEGSATGAHEWASAPTGSTSTQGSASGTHLWTGDATALPTGSVSGAWETLGTAEGSAPRGGLVEDAAWGFEGAASGVVPTQGEVSTETSWTAEATGESPLFTLYSPPVHEEAIRSRERILRLHRLTHAASIVRVGGTFKAMRIPDPELLEGLVDGVDYFRGGYVYQVAPEIAAELAAAGFPSGPKA